jgi:glycosyltransferase involved in cell wall biosynthesis
MTADTMGGVWTHALELAGALKAHGVEVVLATMGRPLARDQREETRALSNVEVCESAFKLEWMDDPWRDVAAAGEWLLALEESVCPSVVHLNGYAHGALPWRSPILVAGHSCVLSWWRAVRGVNAPADWDRYREAVAAGLAGADLVVAPSRAMLEALREFYGPLPAAAVVPNGRRLPPCPKVRKEPLILAAGRLWDEAKNIGALAGVAPELSWPVYVAGEEKAPHGSEIAPGGVQRLGRLSSLELAPWFARASIYALPARYEPFGLSALEAALAGAALVLGDIPSLREVWEDAALYVPPDDPERLKRTLNDLIADPALLAQRSALALHAASRYTPEAMAARYLAAYAEAGKPGTTEPRGVSFRNRPATFRTREKVS